MGINTKNTFSRSVSSSTGACLLAALSLMMTGEVRSAEQNESEDANLYPEAVPINEVEPVVVGIDEYSDPLESVNRIVFAFNDKVYRYALVPLGNVYEAVLPDPVRSGVTRVFNNLQEPISLINNTAQGQLSNAGGNLFRFFTNTVIGVGGIFDPARSWFGVEPNYSTFNDTFTHFGISSGPYLVFPFLGGTDIRRGTSTVISSTLHPVRLVTSEPDTTYIIVFDNFQNIAPDADIYTELSDQADDPYVYFRNQYLQGQNRDQMVNASEE